ncbi:SRPBCC domain-containing protein [Actinomadura fibrosa]|uniref:SRPBCC domain-containing protein n=1 Tax=Actinomadura fibrosa TaxID=111802 RepID=A0ABW2XZ06_9ACTN|nr:SRPBCC domain-containing protein [Actinomadura fibrosa]
MCNQRLHVDEAEIDVRPGGAGRLVWTERATNGTGATADIVVERVEPPHLFSFRWAFDDGGEPADGNSVLVEFTLASEGEGTRLRVTEHGLEQIHWSEEQKSSFAEDHIEGWAKHLGDLAAYAARKAGAAVR